MATEQFGVSDRSFGRYSVRVGAQVVRSRKNIYALMAALTLAVACLAAAVAPSQAFAYGITQTAAANNSITVTWKDPCEGYSTMNTIRYAIGWSEYPSTDPSEQNIKVFNAPATSYTITGLKPGTKYYVQIAYAYSFTSNPSKEYTGSVGTGYANTKVVKPTGVRQTK